MKLGEIQLGILVFMANVVIKFGNQVGLMKAFNRIDFKEDGEIDEEEVRQALAHFLELPSKKAEQLAREFVSKIDLDASGLINYTGTPLRTQNSSSRPPTSARSSRRRTSRRPSSTSTRTAAGGCRSGSCGRGWGSTWGRPTTASW